tara:strand:- start:1871 stop:2044 length:174 start_codon:yes stop_codon:yes gene_type:complete
MDIFNKLDYFYKKKLVIEIPKKNVETEINKEQPLDTIKEEPNENENIIKETGNKIFH